MPRLVAMSLLARSRTTVRHALWLGGMLVVLCGLFGMHGLDNHGGAGMDSVALTAMAVPADGAAWEHEAMTASSYEVAAVADGAKVAVVGAMTDTPGQPGMDASATGMCMAVLFLSLLLLILRFYAARVRPWLWLVTRPVRSVCSHMVHGRDPDPPSLIVLSIQRC